MACMRDTWKVGEVENESASSLLVFPSLSLPSVCPPRSEVSWPSVVLAGARPWALAIHGNDRPRCVWIACSIAMKITRPTW